VDFPAAILPHKKINFAEMLMFDTPRVSGGAEQREGPTAET